MIKRADISLQAIVGLVAGAIIVGLIIIVFIVPAVSFFHQQAVGKKIEDNLNNLKALIATANEKGQEIIMDMQGLALILFNKNSVSCANAIKPESCGRESCICVCKLGKFGILHEEGCFMGKCEVFAEDLKTTDCDIVLKNKLENVVVAKKDNVLSITKKS